ncbi:MAG: serine/threonine-protein kinase [Pirellulales bacterium]
MAQAADNLAKTEPSLVWQQLSERIDALVAAWEKTGEPPELGDFLPAEPATLRQLVLVEAVKVDLEYRWQGRRFPKMLEAYAEQFPELAGADGLPCDLIYEEFHVRKQRGDAVSVVEYCERFPGRIDELRRLLDLEAPEQTTSLVPTEKPPVYEPGQQIDDFDLLASLGKGAFATVFLARQRSMQRLVALKVSRDRGSEPQTLAQLDHPHIVRVYDQRQLPAHKMRLLYMQYIAGGTLKEVVDHVRQTPPAQRSGATLLAAIDQSLVRNGEQPPADSLTRYRLQHASWPEVVCWLGARLAGALAYAHDHGVLHRDVKPANVLVGPDGHPKLADFNISFSKLDGATPAAYFGGSLAYMSPEQLEACDPAHKRQPGDLDARSDVYSLGVLLWELLTGWRPFAEDGLAASWSQVLPKMTTIRRSGLPPEALARLPVGCPPSISEVLRKCLVPQADGRHQTAAEVAQELDLCLQPRARSLLHSQGSWTTTIKRSPVLWTVVIGLLPNIVLSLLNIAYNWQGIVSQLSPEEKQVFLRFQLVGVNTTLYVIGLAYMAYSHGGLIVALSRLARGQRVDPPPAPAVMRKCLTLGSAVAGLSAVLWGCSGFIFPAWMAMVAGPESRLLPEHYAHFVVSNLLCGMIAATQTYYVVTFMALRFCYPWLLQSRTTESHDVTDLSDVVRRGRIFLGITLSVPFIALSAVVLINFQRGVIAGLGGVGLAGCALAYWLDLTIRSDAAALASAIKPGGDPLLSTDSVESLAGSWRR